MPWSPGNKLNNTDSGNNKDLEKRNHSQLLKLKIIIDKNAYNINNFFSNERNMTSANKELLEKARLPSLVNRHFARYLNINF